MRVLIADRDAPLLEALQSYLWDCGHEAEIATDGVECSLILDEYTPDVVVLADDLLWGGSDGVMAKMSESSLLSHVPVIRIEETTHDGSSEAPRSGLHCTPPVVGRLPRPFRISRFMEQVISARHKPRATYHSEEAES